jgi:hypothetical protein
LEGPLIILNEGREPNDVAAKGLKKHCGSILPDKGPFSKVVLRENVLSALLTMIVPWLGMKTDRIRTNITDIIFVFIFMSGFGFEYG